MSFQVYSSLAQALIEVTQSLVRLFPHRKKIFYLKNSDPFLELAAQELARSTLIVEGLTQEQLLDLDVTKAKFDKDTLFVLFSEDDPLLGLSFDFPGLVETLAAQRIYALRLSHNRFRLEPAGSMGKFEARICSLRERVGVLLGERVKVISMIAPREAWSIESVDSIVSEFEPQKSWQAEITQFENSVPAQGLAPLKNIPRLWDRAVVAWDNIDGHAIIETLSKQLGFDLLLPGQETRLETSSLSRWQGVREMTWLRSFAVDPTLSRGLILINPSLLDARFSAALEQTVQQILKIQFG